MVNIIINDLIKIPLIGNYNPINFEYRLFDKRIKQYEGQLNFREIEISNNFSIEFISTIRLEGEKQSVLLSNFSNVYFEIDQKSLFINISLTYDNIFQIFEKLTLFFNTEFEASSLSYDCFSTSMNCNFSCNYCIFNCNSKNKFQYYPIIIANNFINKIRNIIDIIAKPKYKYIRIMGGETLIDLDDFDDVINYIHGHYNKIDNIWIYTNLSININEFIERVNKILEGDKVKKITIIFTSDSMNIEFSNRIKNELLMNQYIRNIHTIIEEFKNNNKILIASNLMYTTYNETLNTALNLYNIGVNFVQISYDEFLDRDKSLIVRDNIHNIYNDIERIGIKRLKPNLSNTMWFHFSISIGKYDIYQCKYSFNSDYIIAKLNNY